MSENKMEVENIKVGCKIIDYGELKAICSLDFGDFVIRGFRISRSKFDKTEGSAEPGNSLWVVPPSYQEKGGKYHPMFFIPDKELWKQLEAHILKKYNETSEEQMKKRFGNPEIEF